MSLEKERVEALQRVIDELRDEPGALMPLVLAAQNRGDLAGQAAERHAVGVNNIPLALDGLGICHKRFHVNSSIILKIRI